MLQVLLVTREEVKEEREATVSRLNTWSSIEVAKLSIFNREANRVSGFLTAYKLYIRMKIRDNLIEK